MSQETFGTLWKRILVYAPGCPLPLAQEFINTAYSRALAGWKWSQLRRDSQFLIPATYDTGTVTVTSGSAVVTGSGTAWTSALEGRQFYVNGSAPFYQVESVDSSTQITLSQVYLGTTTGSGLSYDIGVIYQEMPSDFLQLETIRDIQNNWKLHLFVNQNLLDAWDARRVVSGTPWIASAAVPLVNGGGLADTSRIELWPKCLPGPKLYAYRYEIRPPLLVNADDRPIFPIRGDVLRHGALAELAQWPGTEKAPNPYFNLNLANKHEESFQNGLTECIREENEFCQIQVRYVDETSFPWAPIDAQFWQQHALF